MNGGGLHTVLLVDDEPPILAALRRTLRPTQVRVLTASNGPEALGVLAHETVDVIVSDLDMPGMHGLELAKLVRAQHPHVVRILITGRSSLESALQAINQGEVFRYLTKPWDDAQVREVVLDAISRLTELRRAAAAVQIAERRRRLLADLEREHPGISKRELVDGVYVLDEARLQELSARIADPELRRLLF